MSTSPLFPQLLSRTDHRRTTGFSLIELIVVVLIIGVLLGVGLPAFLRQRHAAQDRAAQADLTSAGKQAKAFYLKNGDSFDGLEGRRPADWVSHRGEPVAVKQLDKHVVCLTTTSGSGTEWALRIVSAPVDGYDYVGEELGRADELGECGAGEEANPVPQAPEGTWATITAGELHTCGLTPAGKAYCWGRNALGQLGLGTVGISNAETPQPVAAGGLSFGTITGGMYHTCGLTPAGKAYCWGFNEYGQLGSGNTGDFYRAPQAVAGGHTFKMITAGDYYTCGLTTDGAAYCWGRNDWGQLGNGDTDSQLIPTPVAGDLTFASITAGGTHTCGLTTDGAAWCWGDGYNGRLGNGDTNVRLVPTPVAGDLPFASITAGRSHTCGLTTAGAAWCWGFGVSGQLGNGDTDSRLVPTPVAGDLTFASITAGGYNTCGLTTGTTYCWGDNEFGQLGNGNTRNYSIPQPVAGGLAFKSITPGGWHTCGITTSGAAYCWGYGFDGQLGNGDTRNANIPQPVDDEGVE